MKRYLSLLSILSILSLLPSCGGHSSESHDEGAEEHEHSHGESSEAELSETQMQTVGITIGLPESRSLSETLSVTGSLAVDPQYQAVASPALPGTVSRILVTEGQRVGAGAVVAYVEVTEGPAMREELQTAQAELEAARTELARQEALASQGAGVRKNLDAARSAVSLASIRVEGAQARMRQFGISAAGGSSLAVKADIPGTVTSVMARTGSFADRQTPVLTIVDNSKVYCILNVFEKDLPSVRKGASVDMRLTNNPEKTFTGKVIDINPVLDPDTKTAPVRVSIEGTDRDSLIPGMGVSASISTGGRQAMALPEDAVVTTGGKSYIFVLEGVEMEHGQKMYHFEKREVVTGSSSMGFVEITPIQPLGPDSRVVTSGAFYISSMTSDHGEHNH